MASQHPTGQEGQQDPPSREDSAVVPGKWHRTHRTRKGEIFGGGMAFFPGWPRHNMLLSGVLAAPRLLLYPAAPLYIPEITPPESFLTIPNVTGKKYTRGKKTRLNYTGRKRRFCPCVKGRPGTTDPGEVHPQHSLEEDR
ncbi:hypothetical protein E2C01_044538 [Portunus trituberculatus]|uniref:Uncharacterized protein n=1 Tax=Portunus trituberculatus TaxID=210409 RepID=A0A5B7G0Q2_PORTR|nr:hypothetical protein [Portunus trituberculatus]